MPATAETIRRHYRDTGLVARILGLLAAQGHDVDKLSAEALYPFDQLHGRNVEATRDHVAKLGLDATKHVLDVGSGIGGPARYMALNFGARVTGIDLTPEFVAAARDLTVRCGLAATVSFRDGDALAMPFADRSFGAVTCLYVAMNIADKPKLVAEIVRVLEPGGRLVWSQVVLGEGRPPSFPLPWARDPSASFLVTPDELRAAFAVDGLQILEWADETETILAFGDRMRATPPSPAAARAVDAVRSEGFSERSRNFRAGLVDGRLRGVVIVAERA